MLYKSIVKFLRQRRTLRNLDLGCYPWELMTSFLPSLKGLRALRAEVTDLVPEVANFLVRNLPKQMHAMHLDSTDFEVPLVSDHLVPTAIVHTRTVYSELVWDKPQAFHVPLLPAPQLQRR